MKQLQQPIKPNKSLYNRIGGALTLQNVVISFFMLVLNDKYLKPYFTQKIENFIGHKKMFARMLGQILGGPHLIQLQKLKKFHQNILIRKKQFDLFATYLMQAFRRIGIEQNDIYQIEQQISNVQSLIVNQMVKYEKSPLKRQRFSSKRQKYMAYCKQHT